MNFRRISLALVCNLLMLNGFCQESSKETSSDDSFEEGNGIYISGGLNYGRFSGSAFPTKFSFKTLGQGGLMLNFLFLNQFPVWSGLEYQLKGYDYEFFQKGTTQTGKEFIKSSIGNARIGLFNIPFLFQFPIKKPSKIHVLAGVSASLRIYFHEKYSGTYRVPQDTLEIPLKYEKFGNDALDFFDFNASVGVRYRVLPWLDFWALANQKAFGFSIGKENFITANELNTLFSFQALIRLGDLSLLEKLQIRR